MNQGSKRVTVRLGDDCVDEIKRACEELNARYDAKREWNTTEFIVQAIVEKLTKLERGRKSDQKFSLEKVDDFCPRVWGE
jgi:hypothetical protein